MTNISQDERERAIFRSRRKFQTDYASDMATAEDRGKEIGMKIGIGIIARNLVNMGMPTDQITEATGLTSEEIDNLRKEIQQ